MSIKIHPRVPIVSQARADIARAILTAMKEQQLTTAELIYILAQEISAWNAYAIRDEREEEAGA